MPSLSMKIKCLTSTSKALKPFCSAAPGTIEERVTRQKDDPQAGINSAIYGDFPGFAFVQIFLNSKMFRTEDSRHHSAMRRLGARRAADPTANL